MPVEPDPVEAHRRSIYHREEVMASETCGCFYCIAIFPPSAIEEWTDDATTAICPKCGIDSVIGSASGYPVTREFLREMKSFWF
ncbi:MAG TPA: cytoplasmic protein [Longimicrobium sp.]|nr:cytoplasmic protein [Longimicrobium sp.]